MRCNWQPLDLNDIPKTAGVYAFKQGQSWLYVGKAKNLAARLNKRHIPLQIALELNSPIQYLYCSAKFPTKLESYLIKKLNPEWNGYTTSDYSRWGCTVHFDVTDEALDAAIATLKF